MRSCVAETGTLHYAFVSTYGSEHSY